jgi:REP element-mobilizing transposase RayT
MPRKPRIVADGLFHHVVHRGLCRQAIFIETCDRRYFLDQLARAARRYDVAVLAYCLMDNHYHLLLQDGRARLSACMALLNGLYTAYINKKYARDGALLRGRFFSRASDDCAYALSVLRYIHRNPVAAGIVEHACDFAWSSHRHYARGHLDPVVRATPMLEALLAIGVRRRGIDQWVAGHPAVEGISIAAPVVAHGQHINPSPLLTEHTAYAAQRSTLETREPKQSIDELIGDEAQQKRLLGAIACQFSVRSEDIVVTAARYNRDSTRARYAAASALFSELRLTYREIADLLGISINSVGVFIRRSRRL